ncbi:MAG: sensor histidine kinase KdpD [Desulfobacteraceae bacterium]|nr:sensor histidine kinase KdpD [Desulfobacteraceae bacterium]
MKKYSDDEDRPSPEALLKLAQAEEAEAERGKLKIFLGYAAGVGKTYAMLAVAQQRHREGRGVVAAYVESHGRAETDALLAGLEVMPKAMIDYQGVQLAELDLDAVLARKPEIALVDELAHSNAPGCRHEKRWQDVVELLTAGIDVYTTVNVQHFESANDLVAQITGVVVRETVPDTILDLAAEIRLVDIPPDELLERLADGKVYMPAQAGQALEKFFQPGNLIALRELSMRRAAARVDGQMRAYMDTRSISGPWPVAERLLVCISGSPFSEKLLRTTRRLAEEMKASWHAVYIETPDNTGHVQENRERIWHDLRLAESMGAQVATVTATSVPKATIDYAVRHHVTKIVVGKPAKSRWRELLRPPIVDQIIRLSGPIDVYVVSMAPGERRRTMPARLKKPVPWPAHLSALAMVSGATLICELVRMLLSPPNMVMIYLLAVVLAAVRLGRSAAILAACLGVLAFDFFFVPPLLTFAVADTEYLVTFASFLVVAVVISTLVATGRERADILRAREVQTASLYYLSRDLAVAADTVAIMKAVIRNIKESVNADLAVFLSEGEQLEVMAADDGVHLDVKEQAVADWAFRNRQAAGRGTATLSSAEFLYLPMQTSVNTLGVLAIKLENEEDFSSRQHRLLLDAFASQTAMALERVRFSRQAEQAQILQARENLERALLNSISHDLRTPLATISAILSSFRGEAELLMGDAARRELLATASGEAERLNRFVGNLLDMTRLEAGAMSLKIEDCDIQDLVGCALTALEHRLGGRKVQVGMPQPSPIAALDMGLMTQVLVNLLDNSLKYSPANSPLTINVQSDENWLRLELLDQGPGVAPHDLKRIFDKFYRIPIPEGAGGTGLGLSICKGVVEAHHGRIRAENRPGGGLKITIKLPLQQTAKEGKAHVARVEQG